MSSALQVIGSVLTVYEIKRTSQRQVKSMEKQEKALLGAAARAEESLTSAREQEKKEALQAKEQLLGAQRALYAKAGVDIFSGSPLLTYARTEGEFETELDKIDTSYVGPFEEVNALRTKARQLHDAQKANESAAKTSAYTTLVQSMSSVAGSTSGYGS